MRTLSCIKTDVGSNAGHLRPTDEVVEAVESRLAAADVLDDYWIFTVGDDIDLLLSHREGEDAEAIHGLAWDAFEAGTAVAEEQGLYGAGQDLLKDAFSGNVRGLGPGVAELTLEERESEPFLVVRGRQDRARGVQPAALHDVRGPPSHGRPPAERHHPRGVHLRGHGPRTHRGRACRRTRRSRGRLAAVGAVDGAAPVRRPEGPLAGDRRDRRGGVDPAPAQHRRRVRRQGRPRRDRPTQKDFPSPGEVVQPYGTPPYVAGAMRGSHHGVLYPVRSDDSEIPSYYDGPPLVKAVGMVLNEGQFSEPVYPFDASFWDSVRDDAAREFRAFRDRQGSFGPGTVESSEPEYGGWAAVVDALDERFEVSSGGETGPVEANDD